MPISPWLIIAVTVIFLGAIFYVVFAPEKPRQTITDATDEDVEPVPDVEYTLEDSDVLDIAIRSNESVVANIDALNAAAVGILALPAAFAVFAIDKIRELPPRARHIFADSTRAFGRDRNHQLRVRIFILESTFR